MTITLYPQGYFCEDRDFMPMLLRFGWHTCPCAHMQINIWSFSWDLYVNVIGRFQHGLTLLIYWKSGLNL